MKFFAVLMFAALLLMVGCAKTEVSPLISEFAENYYQRSYLCDDGTFFLVEADGNQAQVLLGSQTLNLQRTVSLSGEKYQSKRNLYWNRGDTARFEVDGKLFLNCSGEQLSTPRQQARQRGTLVRAVGQESGWIVEITTTGTLVLTNYGQSRRDLPGPVAATMKNDKMIHYLITDEPQQIELIVTKTGCQDSMSGEVYPARAELIIDDQGFNGCADISADIFH